VTRVVVLGYRGGLDEAMRRRGLQPFFVVEKVKDALAGREHVRVADMENAQEVLRAVLARDLAGVRAVVTDHEEAVFTAAVLRAHFGAPGDRDHVRTLRFRDKLLQKRALPAGIARARCRHVTPGDAFGDLAAELGVPFVVKPANGFGARRTTVVGSAGDLAAWWEQDAARSDVQAVAESLVRGAELHVDGVWQDGALAWSCLSRYLDAPMRHAEGAILADGLLARDRHPELFARAEALTAEVLAGLGAPDTVFHLEAFEGDDGTLTFGECAIRVAGGKVPEVVWRTYGVDLYEAVLALALGERAEVPREPSEPERYHGYALLRRFPGVELTEAAFREHFALDELDYPAGADARVGAYGRVGHAIVSHPDSDGLQELLADLVAFNRTGRARARTGAGGGA
jgi:biotin carboxylase